MARVDLESALAAAVDAESQLGTPWWRGVEMAPIARRRWLTFTRRHPKAKHPDADDRVLDLAKGLQAHFEPDIPYNHFGEWLHIAGVLAKVLSTESGADQDLPATGSGE